MFRLDEDLSGFHERVRDDELGWCGSARAECCAHRRCSRTS
jgi:hypothetical protein